MTLLEVRTKVVQISGRYDLVVNAIDYADDGADFYINAAIKMLDRMVDLPDSLANIFYEPDAGEYSITIPNSCRVLQEVWANDSEGRWKLEYLEPDVFRKKYSSPVNDIPTGSPIYYTFIDSRSLVSAYQDHLAEFIDKYAIEGSGYGTRGVVFGPPLDVSHVIDVIGLFHQVMLNDDSDSNFWTYKEEDLLVRTALYKLEAHSRGTENAKNWLSAIRDDVLLIDFDVAAEESQGVTQMEG